MLIALNAMCVSVGAAASDCVNTPAEASLAVSAHRSPRHERQATEAKSESDNFKINDAYISWSKNPPKCVEA